MLELVETISRRKFKEKVFFMLSVPAGNLLAVAVTVVTIALALQASDTWMLYISAFILMTALHPLSHYLIGAIFGIRFTHYYLNGPAKIEPTLRIDYSSYLKASGKRRALMHASGVMGTLAAPLISMSAKYQVKIQSHASGGRISIGFHNRCPYNCRGTACAAGI